MISSILDHAACPRRAAKKGEILAATPGRATPSTPAAMAPAMAPKPVMGGSSMKAPAVGGSKVMGGGMFATFGALLKEALVPLGLLAAQQTYGKTYGKKHRSSGSHTRKHRR